MIFLDTYLCCIKLLCFKIITTSLEYIVVSFISEFIFFAFLYVYFLLNSSLYHYLISKSYLRSIFFKRKS